MEVIRGLKKLYKGMDKYYRDRLFEANCKTRKSEPKEPGIFECFKAFLFRVFFRKD